MEKIMKIEEFWLEKAKELGRTIVLPEASFSERITLAGIECANKQIAKIILLADNDNAFDLVVTTVNLVISFNSSNDSK